MTTTFSGQRVAPLEPDIVGEHFVLQLLEAHNLTDADRSRLCSLAWNTSPVAMMHFVLRAHTDAPRKRMLVALREPPADAKPTRFWLSALVILLTFLSEDGGNAQRLINIAVERAFDAGLVSFISLVARGSHTPLQQQLLDRLWIAIVAAPERVTEIAFEAPPEAVSYFLRQAHRRGENTFVASLCKMLAANPERLGEQAFRASLSSVASLLEAAHDIGQEELVSSIYEGLEGDTERLAEKALSAALSWVAAFLQIAHGQKTVVSALCKALEGSPGRLIDQASTIPLENVGVFLRWAYRNDQKDLVSILYTELEGRLPQLTENALGFQIDSVGHFLVTAHEHGRKRLVAELYKSLTENLRRLVERASATPLHKVGFFLSKAREHGQKELVSNLWMAFAVDPTRWTVGLTEAPPNFAMSLLVTIPPDLPWVGEAMVKPLDVRFWEFGQYRSGRFSTGAPGLALLFGKFGRPDLKDTLISNILRRKNPLDFYDPAHRLIEVSRLLCNASEVDQEHVPFFLDTVCTRSWLNASFDKGSLTSIAGALTNLASYVDPTIVARFWCPGLQQRLSKEITHFPAMAPNALSGLVQFLGSCSLSGWAIRRNLLDAAPLESIGKLPTDVLKHAAGSERVDAWQRQLWLGLRVIATLCPGKLDVGQAAVDQTLALWQTNVAETSQLPEGTPHRINKSMVRWLTRCLNSGEGRLLPDHEPLWVLAGFPQDPRTVSSNI